MVARVPLPLAQIEEEGHAPIPRGPNIKAHPSHLHPARPYRSIGLLSVSTASVDAYKASLQDIHQMKHSLTRITAAEPEYVHLA
jgi:hypothetical protein